jgi:hypothetical protein
MLEGLELGLTQPLGDMFRMHSYYPFRSERILITENGYLDYAIRGGPVVLIMLLWLLVRTLVRSASLAVVKRGSPGMDRCRWVFKGMFAALTAMILVGNFWLNMATEPYSSLFFWLCIGWTISFSENASVLVAETPPPDRHQDGPA